MKRDNYCIVYLSPFPQKKGYTAADKRVRELARGLSVSSNKEVNIIVPRNYDQGVKLNEGEVFVRYFGLNKGGLIGRISFWCFFLSKFLFRKESNLIFYNTNIDSFLPQVILRLFGHKVYLETCDYYSGFEKNIFRKVIFILKEYLNPIPVNGNIVISSFLFDRIKRINPRKPILKIPVVVDYDKYQCDNHIIPSSLKSHTKDLVIAYTGSSYKHEGLRYLIEAASFLKNLEFKLVITGNLIVSDEKDNVFELAEKFGIKDHLVTPGWVSDEEIIGILQRADIVVLPQTKDSFSVAGLPTKISEYAAAGKAIVATNVGDINQYFEDNKSILLCEPENAGDLAEKLFSLAGNSDLRSRLEANAREVAFRFFDYRKVGIEIYQFTSQS